jgi:transcriptional regulator with XRE-family HTH domain
LLRLREAAGLTIEQAAGAAGISMSHLSRVERAQVGVRVPAVKVLLGAYGVDADTVAHLAGVAKDASQRGWWHQYVGSIPEPYATYIGFEAEATQVWGFDASTMPGLLQTEEYARALIQASAVRFTQEAIDRRVAIRLQRQEILTREDPPRIWAVLDEAVIRRQVGGPATLRDQLDRLVEVAQMPHVDVQVLPFEVGAHASTAGAFIVLRFAEPTDPPVVYIETMAGDLYPERQDDIDHAALAFDRLRATALSPDDSTTLIHKTAKELF